MSDHDSSGFISSLNAGPAARRTERLWEAFHRAWTLDVGTPGYDKSIWLEAEAALLSVPRLQAEVAALKAERDDLKGALEVIQAAVAATLEVRETGPTPVGL